MAWGTMKVKELIELLKETDPEFEVFMETQGSGGNYVITGIDESTDSIGTYVVLTDFPVDSK